MPRQLTTKIIEAAIAGFEYQKVQIDAEISELRAMLTSTVPGEQSESTASPKKKREFSAATLKRMREAQKQRWAKTNGATSAEAAPAKKEAPKAKRRLSAAGRKNIIDALKRRMAAKRAEQKSAGKPAAKSAPKAKRRISPEGRQRIIEATQRMWAAKRAAAATAGKGATKKTGQNK